MATKGRVIFSLLIAAAGAAGVGTFISVQKQPAYDPIVTGSNRPDPHLAAMPALRLSKLPLRYCLAAAAKLAYQNAAPALQ